MLSLKKTSHHSCTENLPPSDFTWWQRIKVFKKIYCWIVIAVSKNVFTYPCSALHYVLLLSVFSFHLPNGHSVLPSSSSQHSCPQIVILIQAVWDWQTGTRVAKCQFEVRKGWHVLFPQSKAQDMHCKQATLKYLLQRGSPMTMISSYIEPDFIRAWRAHTLGSIA